ncbi:UTP--glucose-1-phosphate uridylyltransferase GalU [Paractinoplanes ferrugineus]|uniref:UTP--glucose-1-phosphate uridylyltransferase n=1 Tax=Paractinoplanes ferrugineus TaxID=113564 RepID=A0A919J736_9ACTN|nr:sugar phosphate nucleotidyltransferase [Actinoplanes ferrugineus]GIE14233.1 UTP--glucose-1-phosphate uridylyltransferase [Actinoplanes ferrugineus]
MKAIIAVGGIGSRFFPIGKSVSKAMMPILNRPVVAYAIADCIAAGAHEIAFAPTPGETSRQVQHYLTEDHDLKAFFTARGWDAKYAPLADLHHQAEFTFLEQPRDGRYGTALPVMLAAEFIADDDFLLTASDDLLLRTDAGSDLADLAAARAAAATPGALAAATVPGADAHRYGVLKPRPTTHGHQLLDQLVEKPDTYDQPTAYINISRTLLPASALDYFLKLKPAANGEYQATDAIDAFARDHDVLIHQVTGQYHDCGSPAGWLAANNSAAQAQGLNLAPTPQ